MNFYSQNAVLKNNEKKIINATQYDSYKLRTSKEMKKYIFGPRKSIECFN